MDERKDFLIKHFGLRGVAVFEASKGLLAVVGGVWLMMLVHGHKDLSKMTARVLSVLHIGPGRQVYQQILHGAEKMTAGTLSFIITIVLVYAAVRFVEAAGLWLEKEWAEWFAVLTGSLYLPVELWALMHHENWFKWTIFLLNIFVVLYMTWLLLDSHKRKRKALATQKP
ncbi:MAG TPA: DUF2127 domain-containing protein [Verrucomicrobiae bacterium]|jgi:uncharacterized membrane protein (DUF2068 family)|nr:DUF2127 domain-containing protein [Verrucomicrobiae bacterium]